MINLQDSVKSSRQDPGLFGAPLNGERLSRGRGSVREDQLVASLEELSQLGQHHLVEDGFLLGVGRENLIEGESVIETPSVVDRVLVGDAVFRSVESDLKRKYLTARPT